MSFKPDFQLDLINSQLRIRDITGIYNLDNNPKGYGAPNPAINGFVTAALELTDSNGTVTIIDLTDDMPSTLVYEGYFYYPLKSLPSIEDIYRVRYGKSVDTPAPANYYSDYKYFLLAPNTKIKIDKMYAAIEDKLNDSDLAQYVSQVKIAKTLYETLESLTELEDNNNSRPLVSTIERVLTYNKV